MKKPFGNIIKALLLSKKEIRLGHILEESEANKNKMSKKYPKCPKCGSQNIETTIVYYFGVDRNRATCLDCGWKEIINELEELNKILPGPDIDNIFSEPSDLGDEWIPIGSGKRFG